MTYIEKIITRRKKKGKIIMLILLTALTVLFALYVVEYRKVMHIDILITQKEGEDKPYRASAKRTSAGGLNEINRKVRFFTNKSYGRMAKSQARSSL